MLDARKAYRGWINIQPLFLLHCRLAVAQPMNQKKPVTRHPKSANLKRSGTSSFKHKPAQKPVQPKGPTKVILLNKPYDVLCQFTDGQGRRTLADYVDVPGVYAAGRLDRDSEGLLLLTNNGKLNAKLTQPGKKTRKTYWVQVEGVPTELDLQRLRDGIELKDGMTAPAEIKRMKAPDIWSRNPPIRERKNIPDCWLSITLTEGRNRQVRRMTAAIGYPTLRLIRYRIGRWSLDGIASGQWKQVASS